MFKNRDVSKWHTLFKADNKKSSYVAVFIVLTLIISSSLLANFGIGPGGLAFTLFWLFAVTIIIIFLVVPYFKKQRKQRNSSK